LYIEKAGQMESGKVVLVTAAAGGTGQFAVQVLLKSRATFLNHIHLFICFQKLCVPTN